MKTILNVFFKMMQKDDKKEVLKFEIKGNEDDDGSAELFDLSGSIVVFSIKGCDSGDVTAEFVSMQRDSKKTVMKFAIKGDSEDKAQKLYKFAGRNVELSVAASQISIDDYYADEPRDGVRYGVNADGTIDVNEKNQMTIEESMQQAEAGTAAGGQPAPTDEVTTARNKRKSKEKEAPLPFEPDQNLSDDDDLPL